MVLDVGQPLVVETSVATLISVFSGTVDQLLFSQIDSLTLHLGPRLQDAHCAEGPARSARALVLDRRDSSLGGPIDISIDGHSLNINVGLQVGVGSRVQEFLGKFSVAHGAELVESHFVGLSRVTVVFFEKIEILEEDESSESIFLSGIGDTVALLPGEVGVFRLLLADEQKSCGG